MFDKTVAMFCITILILGLVLAAVGLKVECYRTIAPHAGVHTLEVCGK